jgi:cell wall-associated NlpC family hydrolase
MKLVKYFTIPYSDLGRSESGCDCYGLVYLLYRDLLNITMPLYDGYNSEDSLQLGQYVEGSTADRNNWVRVNKPKKGDLAVFNLHGLPQHVAFMLDSHRFIEMTRYAGVRQGSIKIAEGKHTLAYICRYVGEGK